MNFTLLINDGQPSDRVKTRARKIPLGWPASFKRRLPKDKSTRLRVRATTVPRQPIPGRQPWEGSDGTEDSRNLACA